MMQHVTPEMYERLALKLMEAIEGKSFFNGRIEYDTDDFYSDLDCIMEIHKRKNGNLDIVAFKSEYHLSIAEGEMASDFKWDRLLKSINDIYI